MTLPKLPRIAFPVFLPAALLLGTLSGTCAAAGPSALSVSRGPRALPDVAFLGSATAVVDSIHGTLRATSDGVVNNGAIDSGALEVWVVACAGPWEPLGPGYTGFVLATYAFGSVKTGALVYGIDSGSQAVSRPSDGTYYVSVVLIQKDGSGNSWLYDGRNVGLVTFGASTKLSQGRIAVSATYRNQYSGTSGTAWPVYLNDEFSFLAYSDPANPEVFCKVLGANDPSNFQFFIGGTTDFEYTVTFQGCGQTVTYTKPPYTAAGYVNGAAIPKSGCAACASLAGTYGYQAQDTCFNYLEGTLTLAQSSCQVSTSIPGEGSLSGTVQGNAVNVSINLASPCTGTLTGSLAIGPAGLLQGKVSGKATGSGCCPNPTVYIQALKQ